MKINDLGNLRYSVTALNNVIARRSIGSSGGAAVTFVMPHTYAALTDAHLARLRLTNTSRQVIRNHRSAITAWLKATGKFPASHVGPELSDPLFSEKLDDHVSKAGLGRRSQADRRSLLRSVQTTYEGLRSESPSVATAPARTIEAKSRELTPLAKAIFDGCAAQGLRPKSAARTAGISLSAISRWCLGAMPNARTKGQLSKLEVALKMPAGRLTAALTETLGQQAPTYADPFRERQRVLVTNEYLLKPAQVAPGLLRSWQDLLTYKSAVAPQGLSRRPSSRWTLVSPKQTNVRATPFNSVGGRIAPTAGFFWNVTRRFLGFLMQPAEKQGLGQSLTGVQTLAWFAVPEALDGYLNFLTARSDGTVHNGHKAFCTSVASLLQQNTGYLCQQPQLLNQLPADVVRGRSWGELCSTSTQLLKTWKAQSFSLSRSPELGIRYFLDFEWPLSPVLDAVDKLGTIAALAKAGSQENVLARRDRLLLGLLVSNPLRLKNLITISLKPGPAGWVYRTNQGDWRIQVPGAQFKNHKRVGTQNYDVSIPAWLRDWMNDYVHAVRPALLNGKQDSGELFLSATGTRFDVMSTHLSKLTKKLIPGSGGIRPHAFRHLVATDWLTRFPNDYLTVAELLNDSLEVVMKAYAHLKKDSAFSRYEEHVNRMLKTRAGL